MNVSSIAYARGIVNGNDALAQEMSLTIARKEAILHFME